jgi:hypothetical protein
VREEACIGDAIALNIEVDPQLRRFCRREPTLLFNSLIEGRAAKLERVRDVLLRWHSSCIAVRVCLSVGLQKKEDTKIRRAYGWRC